jgi:hypothetical protein
LLVQRGRRAGLDGRSHAFSQAGPPAVDREGVGEMTPDGVEERVGLERLADALRVGHIGARRDRRTDGDGSCEIRLTGLPGRDGGWQLRAGQLNGRHHKRFRHARPRFW